MSRLRRLIWGCAALLALLPVSAYCVPSEYRLINLQVRTNGASRLTDVNSLGHVVGSWALWPGDPLYAICYRSDGIWMLSYYPSMEGCAYAINENGAIAGYVDGESVTWKSVRSRAVILGDSHGRPSDINDSGDIAMIGSDAKAYIDGASTVLSAGTPVVNWDNLFINNKGQLAGYGSEDVDTPSNGSYYAYYWSSDLVRTRLPFDMVLDFNDAGQVLGSLAGSPAFIWNNGVKQDLPISATAMNNRGLVVGSKDGAAVIWENGVTYDPASLIVNPKQGLTFYDCVAVSDVGHLVVKGLDSYYYLLTPVPEPSSILALLGGIGGLAAFGRKRAR